MVDAGVNPDGVGVVRTGPGSFMTGGGDRIAGQLHHGEGEVKTRLRGTRDRRRDRS